MKTLATRITSPFIRLLFLIVLLLGMSSTSLGAVFVSVAIAPPPIPVYVQPVCPGPGYVWVPGYWAWGPDGYYWVPGYWMLAPFIGALWTPGWWGWSGGVYVWHPGYWGPHVGFYGGINYGFGYFSVGYVGGYWSHGAFYYNTTVNNINVTTIHNTYSRQVAVNTNVSRVSFNGGPGGIARQPTAEERLAERDHHRPATSAQIQHQRLASTDRGQLASVNHDTPSVAATPRVAAFRERSAGTGPATSAGAPRHAQPPVQHARPETHAHPPAQHARPETHAQRAPRPSEGSGAMHSGSQKAQREARTEHRAAPRPPQINRETRIERGSPHPGGGPPPRSPQVNREARVEHGSPHPGGGPPPRSPQVNREARIERGSPHPSGGPPHSQNARPEIHAQAAPQGPSGQPRGESRGGRQGRERHEEGHGPR